MKSDIQDEAELSFMGLTLKQTKADPDVKKPWHCKICKRRYKTMNGFYNHIDNTVDNKHREKIREKINLLAMESFYKRHPEELVK